jgi:DNA repair exonuclease SbcCD nuclease subunit
VTKVALINDTHYGIRGNSTTILDFQKKFLDGVFFPELDKRGITDVFHLGDLVDQRKVINIQTLSRMRADFLEPLRARAISFTVLVGNHDIYFKNSIRVNALRELLGEEPWVNIVDQPNELTHPTKDWGTGILLIPWICEENYEEIMQAIADSNATCLMGHLELSGFEMEKGRYHEGGLNPSLFDKFSCVCSGHFHHKSDYKNIHYLGSPWETNWGDYGSPRGFHIFDTTTQELEFIENPYHLLRKVKYADAGKSFEEVMDVDFSEFAGSYVKVIVRSKDNPFWFDAFITKIEEAGAIDVKPVDDHLNLNIESAEDIVEGAETTMTIIDQTIENVQLNDGKKKLLQGVMRRLYDEAIMLQT